MADGKYLLIYKGVGKKYPLPGGGPVVHLAAVSDSPTGPFKKYTQLIFNFKGERFPAEDPYIWYEDGKYRAIVKRMESVEKKRKFSLVQFDSSDGLNWKISKYHKVSDLNITFDDGRKIDLTHLERPQVYLENGKEKIILCAADTLDSKKVRHLFNVQLPLLIETE